MGANAQPYYCDVCRKERSADTNHWWLARITPSTHIVNEKAAPRIELQLWDDKRARRKDMQHACGLTCLITLAGRLAQQLFAASLRKPEPESGAPAQLSIEELPDRVSPAAEAHNA